jgi:hypothetical protein
LCVAKALVVLNDIKIFGAEDEVQVLAEWSRDLDVSKDHVLAKAQSAENVVGAIARGDRTCNRRRADGKRIDWDYLASLSDGIPTGKQQQAEGVDEN